MKICRFNHSHIGIVEGNTIRDVTSLLRLSRQTWPFPQHDAAIEALAGLSPQELLNSDVPRLRLDSVKLDCPVANPSKVIGAPINYRAHIDEANADSQINHGKTFSSLDKFGLFLKANTGLIGPSEEVQLTFPSRRSDHEVELGIVIGKKGRFISRDSALAHVYGYSVALDMTTRGPEFPGFRKSIDTYGVLGPWIVTADEISNPNALDLEISVNGERRQASNTAKLIFNVQQLIEYASRFYTLYPGDIIMTGTPEGVSMVQPGDLLEARIEKVGTLSVRTANSWVGD